MSKKKKGRTEEPADPACVEQDAAEQETETLPVEEPVVETPVPDAPVADEPVSVAPVAEETPASGTEDVEAESPEEPEPEAEETAGETADQDVEVEAEATELETEVESAVPVEEMMRVLRDKGITNLLTYERLFEKWIRDNLSEGDRHVVREFFKKYVRVLYYERGFSVSALENLL